jgi:serine/threonine protein kinase
MHNEGLVHCDIKPENILIDDADSNNNHLLYLIDFGITKRF